MSSEGSVSSSGSRIRQFGLYRTIDARTEEFLRSSRKRQIRQGCACAAISTAITVTVVVSVILVYEYSINSESNVNKKISFKPNWFGLMNESDITSFDSKFNKKINFDRTTLKLLPILLKALNKNRYLEKILEDYSSSSPPYVGKDSTEDTFKRNIFSDAKNWLKMPTSKHYTIDYKTSPLIYWKSPTQRLEYLTKIRKIRDYQRMLKYFDKMINEKVGSNQKRDFEYTENPIIEATDAMKLEKKVKIQQKQRSFKAINNVKQYNTKEDKEPIVSCKCPKKLGLLLNKLIGGIQDMIPHNMINKKLGMNTCGNGTKIIQSPNNFTTHRAVQTTKRPITKFPIIIPRRAIHKSTLRPKHMTFTRKSTTKSTTKMTTTRTTSTTTRSTTSSSTARITTSNVVSNSTNATVTETSKTTETCDSERKYFEDSTIQLPTIANTLLPNYQTYEKNTLDYDSIVRPTDASYTGTTTSQQTKPSTTEMFIPIKFIDSSNEASSTEKIYDAYTLEPPYSRSTLPLFREDDYDDYFMATSTTTNDLENPDVHSFELAKTKVKLPLNNKFKSYHNLNKLAIKTKPLNSHPVMKHKDLDLASMRKMADMIYFPHEKIDKQANIKSKIEPKLDVSSIKNEIAQKLRSMNTNAKITNSVESNTSLTSTKFTSSIKNSIKITSSENDAKLEPLDVKLGIDQGNIDNVGEEEFQDEYNYKPTENRLRYKYKNTTETIKINNDVEKENQEASSTWEILKNEEKIGSKSSKSMFPNMRTSYLEVQRNNDWRQDDHERGDYDINFNNNIFDLPNIN